MKLSLNLLLLAASAPLSWAAIFTAPGASEEECGRLGFMTYDPDELPEGVTPEDLRKCAGHPMGSENYWGWGDYLPQWFP